VIKVSLEGFVGRYFSRELELWANVGLEESEDEDGNHLVLQHLRMKPIDLTHRTGAVFSGAFPFAEVDFQQAANGDVTGLITGNGRTKGVLFERH
jgi:hypothetical protein